MNVNLQVSELSERAKLELDHHSFGNNLFTYSAAATSRIQAQ